MKRLTLKEAKALPVIHQGHFDNIIVQTEDTKVSLSRMTIADGADYDNQITVEKLNKTTYNWKIVDQYEAKAGR